MQHTKTTKNNGLLLIRGKNPLLPDSATPLPTAGVSPLAGAGTGTHSDYGIPDPLTSVPAGIELNAPSQNEHVDHNGKIPQRK